MHLRSRKYPASGKKPTGFPLIDWMASKHYPAPLPSNLDKTEQADASNSDTDALNNDENETTHLPTLLGHRLGVK